MVSCHLPVWDDVLISLCPLQDLCEACGPIESLELLGRGVAEVVFLTKDDAQEAYRRYHRRNLDGEGEHMLR